MGHGNKMKIIKVKVMKMNEKLKKGMKKLNIKRNRRK